MSVIFDEKVDEKIKYSKPRKYNIWALDNPYTSYDEVIFILVKGANLSLPDATKLTLQVDQDGRGRINKKPVSRSVAEIILGKLKDAQRALVSMRPDRAREIKELKFTIKGEE